MRGSGNATIIRLETTAIPAFVVGHVDYAWTGDAREPGQPALSAHPRVLHAVLVEAPGPNEPWFQGFRHGGDVWRALCGTEVLAVTPDFFDDAARWSCKRCGVVLERWLDEDDFERWDLAVRRDG